MVYWGGLGVGAVVLMVSITASASSNSQSLTVRATVQEVSTLSLTPVANHFTIQPGVAVTDHTIATVEIDSNDPQGYLISASSEGNGRLRNADNTLSIPYSITWASNAVALTTEPTRLETSSTLTDGPTNRAVALNVAALDTAGQPAGAFSDTLTITITGQ